MENTILMYLISSLFLLCVNENTETISKDQFHNVKNPLHDLYWLTDLEFYDCEGNVICEFGGFDGRNTCPDFESNVSNMELIWTNDDTNTGTINMKDNPEIQCYLNHGSLVVKFPGTDNPQYNLSVITLDGIIIHSGNYNTWNLRLDNLGLKPKRLYLVSILDSKQKMVYKLFNN